MTTIRDAMGNKWWSNMYERNNFSDPSNKNYGTHRSSALNAPITIDSNPQYSVILSRHCNGVCSYDIGGVSVNGRKLQNSIDKCSDNSGAPNICAKGYMGSATRFAGNPKYDRLG